MLRRRWGGENLASCRCPAYPFTHPLRFGACRWPQRPRIGVISPRGSRKLSARGVRDAWTRRAR
jgi:hypothetical protein